VAVAENVHQRRKVQHLEYNARQNRARDQGKSIPGTCPQNITAASAYIERRHELS
jgi:hypothetical protein